MELDNFGSTKIMEDNTEITDHLVKYISLIIFGYEFFQTLHWASKGASFYSDHQLYDKIYYSIYNEVDRLSEKSIALSGIESINPFEICNNKSLLYKNLISKFDLSLSEDEMAEYALFVVACLMDKTLELNEKLEEKNMLTLGFQDLLPKIYGDMESHMYLLKRRLSHKKN